MIILICDDDKNCLANEEKYIRDNTEAVPECFLGGKELLKRLSAGTEDIAAVFILSLTIRKTELWLPSR